MEFKFETRAGKNGKPEFVVSFEDMECSTSSFGVREMWFRRDGMTDSVRVIMDLRTIALRDLSRWIGGSVKFEPILRCTDSMYDRSRFKRSIVDSACSDSDCKLAEKFVDSDRCRFLYEAPDALRRYQQSTPEYKEWKAKIAKNQEQINKLVSEIAADFPASGELEDVQMDVTDSGDAVFQAILKNIEYRRVYG